MKTSTVLIVSIAVFFLVGGSIAVSKFATVSTETREIEIPVADNKFNNQVEEIAPDTFNAIEDSEEVGETTENDTVEETRTVTITSTVDTTTLPLGDGKLSTSPKKGYVYSCQTQFSPNAGGASQDGSWIQGSTWNLHNKISVQGSVSWPSAWFKSVVSGVKRLLTGNGLPVGSNTGTFPVAKTDPAYQIDRNPNTISEQSVSYSLPSNPSLATQPSCVPMGAVGVMVNGVALFNALDARGDDAVAHEVQDSCNGHPEMTGEYHYHGSSDCVVGADKPNELIGYALDGFGIYSRFDANGNEYSTDDLDECHGIVSEIEWNGEMVEMYHYVITQDYPYTVGCFKGTPVVSTKATAGTGNGNIQSLPPEQTTSGSGGTPPKEATTACVNKSTGASCSFATPKGTISGTCKIPPNQSSVTCVP